MKKAFLALFAIIGLSAIVSVVHAAEPRCAVEPPKYPNAALKDLKGGVAQVAITVDRSGRVLRTELRASTGYKYLDDVAMEAAAEARCSPGETTTLTQTFNFNLVPPTNRPGS